MDANPDANGVYHYPTAGDMVRDLKRAYGVENIEPLPSDGWEDLNSRYVLSKLITKESPQVFISTLPLEGFRDVVTKKKPSFWNALKAAGRLLAKAIWH